MAGQVSGGPARPRHPIVRAGVLVAAFVAVLLLLGAPAASAHAFLIGSTPADGETLQQAPADIHLRFSESVALDAMVVEIVDSHGREHRPAAIRVAHTAGAAEETGGATEDTEEPMEVVIELPPLAHDAYRMSWRTLSSDDLHRTSGVLVFGIGQPVTAAGLDEPGPDVGEVLLRFGIFLALALALGGLLVGRMLTRSAPGHALIARCSSWSAYAAVGGAGGCAALVMFQLRDGEAAARALLISAYGGYAVLRIAGFALLGVAALHARRAAVGRETAGRLWLPATGAIAIGVGTALMSHSRAGGNSVTLVAADAAHVLAGALFTGALLLIAVLVLPAARGATGLAIAPMLRAFAWPAAGSVAVLVASGLYLSSGVVASVDAALFTFYGRVLIAKILLVAAVGVLGLANHRRLRRAGQTQFHATPLRAEASLLATVLILAAVLTSAQPALGPQFVQAGDETSARPVRNAVTEDIQQIVSVQPNRPGRNVIVLDVVNLRRPAPAPVRAVLVQLSGSGGAGGAPIQTRRLADGQWSTGFDIPRTGAFTITVIVKRTGMSDIATSFPWELAMTAGQQRPAVVSKAPIDDLLRSAAVALTIVLAAVGLLLLGRRVRHHPRPRRDEPLVGVSSGGPPSPPETEASATSPEVEDHLARTRS